MIRTLFAFVALVAIGLVNNAQAEDKLVTMAMELKVGETVLATPTVAAKPGEPAEVKMQQGEGRQMKLVVIPTIEEDETVHLALVLAETLEEGDKTLAEPKVVTSMGEATTIEIKDIEGIDGTMNVTITPTL